MGDYSIEDVQKETKPVSFKSKNSFDSIMYKLRLYYNGLSDDEKVRTDIGEVWAQLLQEELK